MTGNVTSNAIKRALFFAAAALVSASAFADPLFPFPGLTPKSDKGSTISGSFTNKFGTRSYKVFVPKDVRPKAGLLVVIHGCFLTGDQMATGLDMNKHAADRGFVVLYPEQGYGDNPWKCFNWFKPENQRRDDGESSIIAGMTKETIKKYSLDAGRVYLTGISAGGAMSANLLGCYSDLYAGALLHSGLEFAAAKTEDEAHQVTAHGPTQDLDASAQTAIKCSPARKRQMPVIVVHGSSDPFVNTINADRTAQQFEKINTLIYLANGGQPGDITHAESKMTQDGYKFSANVTDTLIKGNVVVRKIMVEGMGHGWSGGQPTAPYMEPRGIDASLVLADAFFPK